MIKSYIHIERLTSLRHHLGFQIPPSVEVESITECSFLDHMRPCLHLENAVTVRCLSSRNTCVLSTLESAAEVQQAVRLQIADNQPSSSCRGQGWCECHPFSPLLLVTEQLLFHICKFKIYIITPNPPKLPRDIELMGPVKVFHTCVFLLCLILWEAFWRILQCKFQWDTYSLPQANCHSCRGLLPSCQSRQAGSMCSEITKKAGFIRLLKPN